MLGKEIFSAEGKRFLAEWHGRGNRLEFIACDHYTVDLDKEPEERWREVIEGNLDALPKAQNYLESMLKEIVASTRPKNCCTGALYDCIVALKGDFRAKARKLCQVNPAIDFHEIEAVAKMAGYPVDDFCLLQIAYEVAAKCTSIIAKMPVDQTSGNSPRGARKVPLHCRTLDWGALFLRDLACEITFVRGEEMVFKASTWAGYLGVLTGMRPGCFSVSINYRKSANKADGSLVQNFERGLNGAWPVGYLVRHLLSRPDAPDYEAARLLFSSAKLMAPVYFTVGGISEDEGCVISRGPERNMEAYSQSLATAPITQTNVDCKTEYQHRDAKGSAPRRVCSVFYFKEKTSNIFPDREAAWELLQLSPINNSITLYGTVMCAAEGTLETRKPDDTELRAQLEALSDPQKAQELRTKDAEVIARATHLLEIILGLIHEHAEQENHGEGLSVQQTAAVLSAYVKKAEKKSRSVKSCIPNVQESFERHELDPEHGRASDAVLIDIFARCSCWKLSENDQPARSEAYWIHAELHK